MRLVLLLKADGQYKHSGKYALVQGRWHKIHGDKPAPKGAPVAAHPHAAGEHAPAKHFSDEEWGKLKLPEGNVNAPSYNKHLDKLKEMSEAGHVTGILGMQFGTNTYGKKAATVANHLLKLHGSQHQVSPGQKAGEHPAVKQAPADNTGAAGSNTPEQATNTPADQPTPSVSAETVPAPATAEASPSTGPQFDDTYGKAKFYTDQATKVQAMADAGDTAGLAAFKEKNKDKTIFGGKTKNSQIFMQFWDGLTGGKPAEAAAAPEPAPAPGPVAQSAPASKLDQIPWDKLKLPDTNSNANHHNTAIDKIKALAEAGDVDGLQALYDKKKDSKQTYTKKQALLAQTALAALKEDGSPGDQTAPQAAPEPKQVAPDPVADGKPQKPDLSTSQTWQAVVNEIEKAMSDGDKLPIEQAIANSQGLASNGAKLVNKYAKDALDYLNNKSQEAGPQKPSYPAGSPWNTHVDFIESQANDAGWLNDYVSGKTYPNPGPASDDGKAALAYAQELLAAAGGAPSQEQGPKEGDTKEGADGTLVFHNGRWHKQAQLEPTVAEAHPVDEVPEPNLSSFLPSGQVQVKAALQILKDQIKAGDLSGLKGATKKMGTGNFIVKLPYPNNPQNLNSKFTVKGKGPGTKNLYDYVEALKAAAGKPKKVAKPKAAAAPVGQPEEPSTHESMDHWQQTGPQGGSNPGGKFKDENGVEWYCKFPGDDDVAKSEVLAAKLYAATGVLGQDAKLVTKDGKLGIASKWQTVQKGSASNLAAAKGALSGFAVDAWLANWDVVGLALDNLQLDEAGNAVRVDAGGSLQYRAQGGKKAFGSTVSELDTLRDPTINPQSASVFGKMTDADIAASVAKVGAISDAQIRAVVAEYGPGDAAAKKDLADTLIARKADLLAKYPQAAKKTAKKRLDPTSLPVDADRLPNAHDFTNWLGQGKPLSSQPHVNAANMAVEQEMLAIAKTGNLTKLKEFKFHAINKETGTSTGQLIPIAQHPSKHIVQFHADLVQALDEIANPPQPLKLFQEADVGTLGALDAAFPPKKFGTTVSAVHSNEKLGFWVVLGGVTNVSKFKPSKVMDYTKSAIDAAYVKFKQGSKLAKHFIGSVQSSGSYNDLFRDGKEFDHSGNKLSDVAKAAQEHATSMPEGTSIYRWQSMPDDMVKKVLSAPEGTVFQATGPMCTSYSPTGTSGFGKHRVVVRYAKGAKAVESFGSGNFSGEKEVTTLPNSRFVILKREMVPDVEHGNPSGKRLELEVLMLPPDLGL